MRLTRIAPALALALPISGQLRIQTDAAAAGVWDALHTDAEFVLSVGSQIFDSDDEAAPAPAVVDDSCPADPGPSCPVALEDRAQLVATKYANSCCVNAPGSYFALTQFWDATPFPVGPEGNWTLHGLWPDYCSESPTDWPSMCDNSRNINRPGEMRDVLKNEPELVAFMDEYWIPDRGTAESFWEHEWNKHGTCVSTLFPDCYTDYIKNEEVVHFMKTAVSLFKGLPTHDFLAVKGIVPSTTETYTLAQLQDAAKASFGHEASWGCKRSGGRWELSQVFWGHVSVGQSRTNPIFLPAAPGSQAVNSCPATGISYFPKDGSAPRPGPPGSPRPPSGGKAFIKVVFESVETGCLISTGKWLVGGTCAGYSVTGSTKEDFYLTTSKGPCQVSRAGVFTCANRLKPTTFTLDADGNLKLPSGSFYAPSIPGRGTQVSIVTEKGPHPVQLLYVAGH